MTFRRRVVLLSAGAVALAIAIAMGAAYLMVSSQLNDQVDRNLQRDAGRVSDFTLAFAGHVPAGNDASGRSGDGDLVLGPRSETEKTMKMLRKLITTGMWSESRDTQARQRETRARNFMSGNSSDRPDYYSQIVSADGQVTRRPTSQLRLEPDDAVMQVADGKKEPFFYQQEIDGVPYRILVSSIGDGYAVQVARPLSDVNRVLDRLAWVLGIVTLAGIGLAALFGFFVARAALSPVTRFTEAAESIAETRNLAHRMELVGDQDLDRLARSFNTMMDALEQSLNTQQQLVADASHELRTPLTSLRANSEVLLLSDALPAEGKAELVNSIVFQIDEMTKLIGDLMDLARETETDGETSEKVRLDELVEGVIEHRADRLTIDYESEPCELVGVPEGLERAVANLIDNAVKWAPADTEIEVRVGGTGIITVRDYGPGVAPEDANRIFDRFYRSPEARGLPGSGLGLSIVRQIAGNHDGTVSVSAPPGGGACFTLDLSARVRPLARPPLRFRLTV